MLGEREGFPLTNQPLLTVCFQFVHARHQRSTSAISYRMEAPVMMMTVFSRSDSYGETARDASRMIRGLLLLLFPVRIPLA